MANHTKTEVNDPNLTPDSSIAAKAATSVPITIRIVQTLDGSCQHIVFDPSTYPDLPIGGAFLSLFFY